ncbi:MAG: hypothetical protein ACOYOU_18790 [Kiritimatiellia bacterium]
MSEMTNEQTGVALRTQGGVVAVQSAQAQAEVDIPAMMGMSELLIKSGFLPATIKTPAQAVAIVLTGRELGIPTMQALRQINVVQGKPTISPELMLCLAYQRIPGFIFEVTESTAERCACTFKRPNHPVHEQTFTMADAKGMGLAGKDNWIKQPAVMLRWRCISAGLRLVAPDAIAGTYTPEEMMPDGRADVDTGLGQELPESLPPAIPKKKQGIIHAPVVPLHAIQNSELILSLRGMQRDATEFCQAKNWIPSPIGTLADLDDSKRSAIMTRLSEFRDAVEAWAKERDAAADDVTKNETNETKE